MPKPGTGTGTIRVSRYPINAFPIEELYTPEFLESLQENTGYWQEPNTYEVAGSEGSSKRHKSSGSSSFNTESGDASINLNTTVADEDEVQSVGSSTMNDDALARLMVNEMTAAEIEQRDAFMELKRREVECREREIAATKYRAQQEDIKLYLQPYDHLTGEQRLTINEIRAKIKAKYNLQY
ncbi:hypothetical protein Tco_1481320 [Tanacetum coccineum]